MIFNVNVYIDEISICEIRTKSDFISLIDDIMKFCKSFRENVGGVEVELILWRHSDLESKSLHINGQRFTFLTALNNLLDVDKKFLFKKLFYEKLSKVWNEERVHSLDDYFEMPVDICITGDTLAECAELTQVSTKYPLAFVNKKIISGKLITITKYLDKTGTNSIDVELANEHINPNSWLNVKYNVADFFYDMTSNIPPTDMQTYLRDKTRYTKTTYLNQGRTVYFCNLEQNHHVVDNYHYGPAAHIEVWHRYGDHLGENDINGVRVRGGDKQKNNPNW